MHRIFLSGAALLLLAPFSLMAQTSCPPSAGTQSGELIDASTPTDIGPNQPFTLLGRFCPGPVAGASVQFTISDSNGKTLAQQTSAANSNGFASFTVGAGLPAGTYSIFESPIGVSGSFTFGGSNLYIGGGPGAALVSGQYAFILQGTTGTQTPGAGHMAAAVGSFTADGQGGITSGVIDLNSPDGVLTQAPVTGRYTYFGSQDGLNGQNTFTLNTPFGPQTLVAFNYPAADVSTAPLTRAILNASGVRGFTGTGSLLKQTLPANPSQTGLYALQLTGETACDTRCATAGGQAVPASVTGTLGLMTVPIGRPFSFAISGIQTVGVTSQNVSLTGTNTFPDENGRLVLQAAPASAASDPGAPVGFVVYQIDSTRNFLLSTDPHAATALVFGTADL